MGDVIKLRRGRESYWNGAGATVVPAQGETVLIYDDAMNAVIGVKYGNGLAQMQNLTLFAPGGGGGGSDYDSTDFDADFSGKTTDDLEEGNNKFVTSEEKTKIANLPDDTQSDIDSLSSEIDGKLGAVRDQVITSDAAYTIQSDDSGKIIIHTFTSAGDKKLIVNDSLPNGHLSTHVAAGKSMIIEKAPGATATLVYDGYEINSGDSFFLVKGNTGSNNIWVIRTSPSASQVRDKLASLPNGSRLSYNDLDDTPGAGYDSSAFDTDFAEKTTDELPEGTTNKYVTADEKLRIGNLPADTTGSISALSTVVDGKVDKIRQNTFIAGDTYTLQPSDSMRVLVHDYNGVLDKKLIIDDTLPNGFFTQHIVANKDMAIELAAGSLDTTLVYDGNPFSQGEGFLIHKAVGSSAFVYVIRYKEDVPDITIGDEVESELRDTNDQVMLDNMGISWPDDTGSHILKTTDISTTLTITEGLDEEENARLPNLIIISTEPGAGDITLASDVGNTLSVDFRYLGAIVDTLPGDGYFSYGLRLKPGTSSYIVDAKGGVPYLFQPPVANPVQIVPATVFSFPTNQNDPVAEPLSASYNLDLGSYNDPTLWVIAWGSGGGGKTAFTGATAGAVAMNKAFDALKTSPSFVKHAQVYMLPEASAPTDGSITITIGEDAGTVDQNRGMIVFVVENSDQTVPTLLSVTGSDSSRTDIRFSSEGGLSSSNLSLGTIAGEHLAVNFFTTNAGVITADGDAIAEVVSVNWNVKLTSKNGEDQALGFTCSTPSTGTCQHLVFAIEKVSA